MAKFNFRKLWRVTHRDLGYLIAGLTLVYALSGIALNHRNDWDPSYIITEKNVTLQPEGDAPYSKEAIVDELAKIAPSLDYRKHINTSRNTIKVFVKGGTVEFSPDTGEGWLETIRKRPLFFQVNTLHYGKNSLWIWFSDTFAALLFVVTLTGLFILKGKNGITRRGLWLTLAGILVPLSFLIWVF